MTRARILPTATQLDTEIFEQVRLLLYKNWKQGVPIRLLGVQASSFNTEADQMSLLEGWPPAAVEGCAFGCGPPARQIWGIQHYASSGNEGQLPRAHAGEPGGIAGKTRGAS
jgi:hypothetical protein